MDFIDVCLCEVQKDLNQTVAEKSEKMGVDQHSL